MTQQAMLPSAAPAAQLLPLRDYQTEALDAIDEARGRGITHQLVSLATGAGKTVIAAHLVRRMGTRAVFMVHRDELAQQSLRQLAQANPNLSIGLCKAERDDLGADVIVASAQTLARPARLARLAAATEGVPLLFLSDECHHDRAESRQRAIDQLAPREDPSRLLVGLTATPTRGDRLGLDAIYDEIVYHLPMLDLMGRNYLARLKGIRIETDVDLDGVHTRYGEFVERELDAAVDTPERNTLIVQAWREHAAGRKRTLAFCASVAHARHLVETFREAGVEADAVFGETPFEERQRIFARFHSGDIAVLCNVMVATEGYDEPAIDCIVMARPTQSPGLYIQMAGRGARKSPEKSDCLVLDFADNTSRHSLVMFPTLAGAELQESLEEQVVAGEPVDLLAGAQMALHISKQRAVEVDLFGQSPVVWQRPAGSGVFFAPAGGEGDGNRWVLVVASPGGYVPYRLSVSRSSYDAPLVEPLFDRPLDVETAQSLAEESVVVSALTSRKAAWRQREEQPSDAQLRFAKRLGVRDADRMTKAQVSEAINARLFMQAAKRAGLEVAAR
ncbi:MAG: DEAD/DEAH box helicase [Dehalococcoidia bacterium]|nr:DEAD/DEAH box helicase [Dehalococcoidia bacterium]